MSGTESKTCYVLGYDDGWDAFAEIEYAEPQWDLSCGHACYGTVEPNYCPECGAKVVEYEPEDN